jgi:predicted Zn-ribbon and HTH transcriptional regulator
MSDFHNPVELADIFRKHGEAYQQQHTLWPQQQKAFDAIMQCRTMALGGHLDHCDHCGYTRPSYNSCRNRHCPKCQFLRQSKWVDKLAANLPPVKHFHVVFTIPSVLNKLFYLNQTITYGLLFKAAGASLSQCAANPTFLGAQAGAVAMLHTWSQTLVYHPHIHMIVPAGGLSEDQSEWIPSKDKFFLPVKVLSRVFRGMLVRFLQQALENHQITLPKEHPDFASIKNKCYEKPWVVYCEKPFSDNQRLLLYLGHYTHRVAISNHRIKTCEHAKVRFSYKDNRSAGINKQIALDASEFIRRFLSHVLPHGFYKIRYFGFMAMCNAQTKLAACFDLIDKPAYLAQLEGLSALDIWRHITGTDPLVCPKCKTARISIRKLPENCEPIPG